MPFYALTTHNGDGATTTFSIGFTYVRQAFVKVYISAVEQTRPSQWDFDGAGTNVVFVTPPPTGTGNITIERQTDLTTRVIDFTDGSGLTEEDLDDSAQQLFDILQETNDDTSLKLGQTGGVWDAGGLRIINVGTPSLGTDATTPDAIAAQVTAAQAAQTAAEAAQTAAETAQTGAETAETGAQTAQTAAETAQTGAEAAEAALESYLNTNLMKAPIQGLTLSRTGTATVGVAAGGPWPFGNALASAFTKVLTSTWASGTTNGGLKNGLTFTANTVYYVHLLRNSSTGATDIGCDVSRDGSGILADSAVIAAGFDTARRLGRVVADAAGTDIRDFIQKENEFRFKVPYASGSIFGASLGSTQETSSAVPGVPTGSIEQIILSVTFQNSASLGCVVWLGSPSVTPTNPSRGAGSISGTCVASGSDGGGADTGGGAEVTVLTDTSALISGESSVSTSYTIELVGWVDDVRGAVS